MCAAEGEIKRARELILQFGWNATCYQILNPGFELWFSARPPGVVGYVQHRGRRIVGGAPVSSQEDLREVAGRFERETRAAGLQTCYFGAESRLEAIYRRAPDHAMIVLGSQPVWKPSGWPDRIKRHASLRAQVNRAKNKGMIVEEWPAHVTRDHPALRRCLHEWLDARGLPPLHFLIETDTLSRVEGRRVFVARLGGAVAAFLVASPVPQRNGWLVEQIVRGETAPNGTSELLIDAAMQAMIESGSEYVTLGLVPLSTHTEGAQHENPWWLRTVLGWMRNHGRRYYNFRGLEAFKAKFDPDRWDPVYAIVDERRIRPATLYAVAAAFAQGSPLRLLGNATWTAFRKEVEATAKLGSAGVG